MIIQSSKEILLSEDRFVKSIDRLVDKIINSNRKIIALAGPTSSGKTTTSLLIESKLEKLGKRVVQISIDDFFLEISREEKTANSDLDSPDTIDSELFSKCVKKLMAGEKCEIPRFDFKTGFRSGYSEIIPQSDDIFLFEGIQSFYPNVASNFPSDDTFFLYISVRESLNVEGEIFFPDEIRFIRRMIRDYYYRNASFSFTAELWKNVRQNEINNIEPYINNAQIIISSLLLYEVNMMKDVFLNIVTEKDCEENMKVSSIVEKLKKISSMDVKLLPSHSLLNEFLGKAREEKYEKKNN